MIVPIPDDIYCYEHKVWGNFTKRQLICGLIALAVIFTVFIPVFWKTSNPRLSCFLAFVVAFPVILCGVWKKDGQYPEKVIWYQCRQRFKFPQKRKFVMSNLYEIIQRNQKEYESAYEEYENKEQQKKKKSRLRYFTSLVQKRHGSKQHPV
ncbi:PrgI family protein [Caprobacter fermentans]|uniref:PrgI family protein n=1 Tax=Caproicibacter fermentans TaxID=2576756 RepID=A0A6N8HYS6_9FIRM|nr:PrgI family protein [Caproicibacter fermentans]MVB10828.1 PrgI family protein [Caproicibacter fermentans]OCN03413.1 hypothetical protein A7X67_11045 [Clostridium sp. W14A]